MGYRRGKDEIRVCQEVTNGFFSFTLKVFTRIPLFLCVTFRSLTTLSPIQTKKGKEGLASIYPGSAPWSGLSVVMGNFL